ncbi:ATP-binding protein [Vallitaleaceae bacterium 9-2]
MGQLLVLSGKGGTGKTTVASALIQLSKVKHFADCDVDAPNLDLVMHQTVDPIITDYSGLPKAFIHEEQCIECGQCQSQCRFDAISHDQVKKTYVVDLNACEGCGVCELVCPVGAVHLEPIVDGHLQLYKSERVFSTAQLKMGSGTSGMLVTKVKRQMLEHGVESEWAIIDGSPGIGCPVIASISGVDYVLIVAEPSLSGISDMERIVTTASRFGVKTFICVNKFDVNIEYTDKIEAYAKAKGLDFVGRIPYDSQAVKVINQGKTIVEIDCASGRAVQGIYENIKKVIDNGGNL